LKKEYKICSVIAGLMSAPESGTIEYEVKKKQGVVCLKTTMALNFRNRLKSK